jgi:hypothetical protein
MNGKTLRYCFPNFPCILNLHTFFSAHSAIPLRLQTHFFQAFTHTFRHPRVGGGSCPRILKPSDARAYPLSFHTIPNSYATRRNLSSVFSGKSKLLRQNTRGGWGASDPERSDLKTPPNIFSCLCVVPLCMPPCPVLLSARSAGILALRTAYDGFFPA